MALEDLYPGGDLPAMKALFPRADVPRGDALGDRMKGYEDSWRISLPRRMPVVIRVDGKAFHTATRSCAKPFDLGLSSAMDAVAVELCEAIQGAVFAYVQSDEVSVLLNNYRTLETQAWFGNLLQKMVSVAASVATAAFAGSKPHGMPRMCTFDARAFVLPESEVANYFVWRQKDAVRNSTMMVARSVFSQKELQGVSCRDVEANLDARGIPLSSFQPGQLRGRAVSKEPGSTWEVDRSIPLFWEDRLYVERHIVVEDPVEEGY